MQQGSELQLSAELESKMLLAQQDHLINHFKSLQTPQQKQDFLQQLQGIDFKKIPALIEFAQKQSKIQQQVFAGKQIAPVKEKTFNSWDFDAEKRQQYVSEGLKLLAEGKAAFLTMAGGSATRLKSNVSKGIYNIGLPSHRNLFQVYIDQLKALMLLASEVSQKQTPILWLIMTSDTNHVEVEQYFKLNDYFGYNSDYIVIFQQGTLPVIGTDGKILLSEYGKISVSGDGNGGMYEALEKSSIIEKLEQRGVEYVFISGIDNLVLKILDPLFIGFQHVNKYEFAAKTIPRLNAKERVGVFASLEGRLSVLEYTELGVELAEKIDQKGELMYDTSHILITCLQTNLLKRCVEFQNQKYYNQYHLAEKDVKCFDTEVNEGNAYKMKKAWKFEKFYFDVFPEFDFSKCGILQVKRQEEFAPIKNARGELTDTQDTAMQLMTNYNLNWLKEQQVQVAPNQQGVCEIHPSIYFMKQQFLAVLKQQIIFLPTYISQDTVINLMPLQQKPQECCQNFVNYASLKEGAFVLSSSTQNPKKMLSSKCLQSNESTNSSEPITVLFPAGPIINRVKLILAQQISECFELYLLLDEEGAFKRKVIVCQNSQNVYYSKFSNFRVFGLIIDPSNSKQLFIERLVAYNVQ